MTAPQYKLLYFNIRGLGEEIRLFLNDRQIPHEDERVSNWPEIKKDFAPLHQLPNLIVSSPTDGSSFRVPQSRSILRFLARKYNGYGKTEEETYRCDIIADTVNDWRSRYTPTVYREWDDLAAREVYLTQTVPRYLNAFEYFLNDFKTNWFSGAESGFADAMVWELLDIHVSLFALAGKGDLFEGVPTLKAFYDAYKQKPGIKAYIESGKRPTAANAASAKVLGQQL
ncbi:hypothetical protein HDV05_004596 [Chytridiales sp. JEL 0842]|nr:hypothetical protein HDV05_004596 [Chytridiales sp. JEL 0842]